MTAATDLQRAESRTAIRRRVEHCDIDSFGVVHFARVPAFMETAVLASLARLGLTLTVCADNGWRLAVRRLEVVYLAPALANDEIEIFAQLEHAGLLHILLTAEATTVRGDETVVLATAMFDMVVTEAAVGKLLATATTLKQ